MLPLQVHCPNWPPAALLRQESEPGPAGWNGTRFVRWDQRAWLEANAGLAPLVNAALVDEVTSRHCASAIRGYEFPSASSLMPADRSGDLATH